MQVEGVFLWCSWNRGATARRHDVTRRSIFLQQSDAVKYPHTIIRTVHADHDQIVVRHVVDEVDVVPSVFHELLMVPAETEITQPLSD